MHLNSISILFEPFVRFIKNKPNCESDYTCFLPVKINRQPDVNYLVAMFTYFMFRSVGLKSELSEHGLREMRGRKYYHRY